MSDEEFDARYAEVMGRSPRKFVEEADPVDLASPLRGRVDVPITIGRRG